MINKDYDFKKNQDKWNKYWEENETFKKYGGNTSHSMFNGM